MNMKLVDDFGGRSGWWGAGRNTFLILKRPRYIIASITINVLKTIQVGIYFVLTVYPGFIVFFGTNPFHTPIREYCYHLHIPGKYTEAGEW